LLQQRLRPQVSLLPYAQDLLAQNALLQEPLLQDPVLQVELLQTELLRSRSDVLRSGRSDVLRSGSCRSDLRCSRGCVLQLVVDIL
jgi:hypothetical protein